MDLYQTFKKVFEVKNPKNKNFILQHTLQLQSDVFQLAWSPDGSKLAVVTSDSSVIFYDSKSRKTINQFVSSRSISSTQWSPDSSSFALILQYNEILILEANSGTLISELGTSESFINKFLKISNNNEQYYVNHLPVSWSPDGSLIASAREGNRIKIWNPKTGEEVCTLKKSTPSLFSKISKKSKFLYESEKSTVIRKIIWSPDGSILASKLIDGDITLWNPKSGEKINSISSELENSPNYLRLFIGTDLIDFCEEIAWSPDEQILLVSNPRAKTIEIFEIRIGQKLKKLYSYSLKASSIAWSPDGSLIAFGSENNIIRLLSPKTGKEIQRLEGCEDLITTILFSPDGNFLVGKTNNQNVKYWRCDTWEEIISFTPTFSFPHNNTLDIHPNFKTIATIGNRRNEFHLWELNAKTVLESSSKKDSLHYANAKVVLVGDSGVGKSGLGLVLKGDDFQATESTHGRHVWTLDKKEDKNEKGVSVLHETLLWDLAGQPGYRLVHQLSLSETAVALVVFDARSETDPFAGVYHWTKALKQACQRIDSSPIPLKKFLVAARTDRGGTGVSQERIDKLVEELGFDGYFVTSAKEGTQIEELAETIRNNINWDDMVTVSSNQLFKNIQDFLLEEKEAGRLLSTKDDLYRAFLKSNKAPENDDSSLSAFEICISLVESRGLIRRLSFGGHILLQPEKLDVYASALVNQAKEEPEGMGHILEEDARNLKFSIPKEERLSNNEQEKILMIATLEDMLKQEVAIREQEYLVFPSQFSRELPGAPEPKGKAVTFRFDGPVINIYSTLAVRLFYNESFKKIDMWKNAVIFEAEAGGVCGIYLRDLRQGQADLIVFFDPNGKTPKASAQTKKQFENFIESHLKSRAVTDTIQKTKVVSCKECDEPFTDSQIEKRKKLGKKNIICAVCDTINPLIDPVAATEEETDTVRQMDQEVNVKRDEAVAVSTLEGKVLTEDYDVFLCHNSKDKYFIIEIRKTLMKKGILPWLDKEDMKPGENWRKSLEEQITKIKVAAVFIGAEGIGKVEDTEINMIEKEYNNRKMIVLPVILKDMIGEPKLTPFLEQFHRIDFREDDPDPMEQLIWGITEDKGKRF
jgi:small GTP-binding protein